MVKKTRTIRVEKIQDLFRRIQSLHHEVESTTVSLANSFDLLTTEAKIRRKDKIASCKKEINDLEKKIDNLLSELE